MSLFLWENLEKGLKFKSERDLAKVKKNSEQILCYSGAFHCKQVNNSIEEVKKEVFACGKDLFALKQIKGNKKIY